MSITDHAEFQKNKQIFGVAIKILFTYSASQKGFEIERSSLVYVSYLQTPTY